MHRVGGGGGGFRNPGTPPPDPALTSHKVQCLDLCLSYSARPLECKKNDFPFTVHFPVICKAEPVSSVA